MVELQTLYANRFSADDLAWKQTVWRILCERVFQAYIPAGATVVDIGAGSCEFINAIKATRRIAVDLNPALPAFVAPGVEAHNGNADDLTFLPPSSVDVVFSSNFLEHLPTKDAVLDVLRASRWVLRPGGLAILLGPNARIIPGAYWDYFDHHVPLTERSIAEALGVCGFEVVRSEARFLPYTVKSRLPRSPLLVRLFLTLHPLTSRLVGGQFLVVATTKSVKV